MKIICIGDIHGRSIWKGIVARENNIPSKKVKIIFHGDYFDSFVIRPEVQIENFRNILAYKIANPDNVILLFGNHDFHYLPQAKQLKYSGYNSQYAATYGHLLSEAYNAGYFQICHKEGSFWFSHAGISKTFCTERDLPHTPEAINNLFYTYPHKFEFCGHDYTGDDVSQTPIWIRPKSLMKDAIEGKHVVGHTGHYSIATVDDRFYFIDTLGTLSPEYLKISNGKVYIKKADFEF